jgi:hypothetical protein
VSAHFHLRQDRRCAKLLGLCVVGTLKTVTWASAIYVIDLCGVVEITERMSYADINRDWNPLTSESY